MHTTDFWVVFDTNASEASGFLSTVPLKSFLLCGFWLLATLFTLILSNKNAGTYPPHTKTIWRYSAYLIAPIVVVCSFIYPFRLLNSLPDFSRSIGSYIEVNRINLEVYGNREAIDKEAYCKLDSTIKKTFVIVIGESASRLHYGLYGYPRNTTPRLDSIREELSVFKDVISPAAHTMAAMKDILTFSTYESPERDRHEATLIELLKSAGYRTIWIDMQGTRDSDEYLPATYRVIARMCDYFLAINETTHDLPLLPVYREECIEDTAQNKVIFLHLQGSHMGAYSDRYPSEFEVFKPTDKIPSKFYSEMNKKDIAKVNAYDNSIYFNDFILSEIISELREEEGLSAFLYFSDHGEEVFDYRNYSGRSLEKGSVALCQVPFILWRNDKHIEQVPLSIDEYRPYCTDDVIHAILELSGVEYNAKDSTRSIFNAAFRPKKRMMQGYEYSSLIGAEKIN